MAVLKLLGLTQSLTNPGRTRSALRVMLRFLSAGRSRSAPTLIIGDALQMVPMRCLRPLLPPYRCRIRML